LGVLKPNIGIKGGAREDYNQRNPSPAPAADAGPAARAWRLVRAKPGSVASRSDGEGSSPGPALAAQG